MPKGTIVKSISNLYYVEDEENVVTECHARGIFKKKKITPLVGDRVMFKQGMIEEIFPRKNELIRPPIANVTQAILIFSATEPQLNLQLLDKFLVHVEYVNLRPIIGITKLDLLKDQKFLSDIIHLYERIGYPVIPISIFEKKGVEELAVHLKGETSVLAGQSGVGKSSLLNALKPSLNLATGVVSEKIGRGKHTTRHVELISLTDVGYLADTPGFSQLDFEWIESDELGNCFKEFRQYIQGCKFRGCSHTKEPGCEIINQVNKDVISRSRYDHYVLFYDKIHTRRKKYKKRGRDDS